MFKFIHCADVHLDSPLKGLEKYAGAPSDQIRGAVRLALDNLFHLAVAEKVAFVLIAGDIYDGNWDDHQTGLHFSKWLSRFHDHAIAVHAITGNHDAENKMTRTLVLPKNPSGLDVMLSSRRVESVRLDDIGVVIHGRGFADQEESENLVLEYPSPVPDYFNIGMLHTSLDGAAGGTHKRYAPCSPSNLHDRGYQYWALGHVHTRKHHHKPGQTPIVFPGNIQGRHVRETGPKGCEVVTVDNDGKVSMRFEPLDVFRFELCHVDVTGVTKADEVLSRFAATMKPIVAAASGMPMAARVIVHGVSEAHDKWLGELETWRQSIRSASFGVGGEVWIEKVKFETRPLRKLSAEDLTDGPIAELIRCFDEMHGDEIGGNETGDVAVGDAEGLVNELLAELDSLKNKLPAEVISDDDPWLPRDAASLKSWLDEVQPMLMYRLMTEEAS